MQIDLGNVLTILTVAVSAVALFVRLQTNQKHTVGRLDRYEASPSSSPPSSGTPAIKTYGAAAK